MPFIGFGCTAQVGKDTAADYLEQKYRGRAIRVSFADKLKQVAMDLFDLSHDQCYGPNTIKEAVDPRYGLTPREIMMGLGDKMREIYAPIWIERAFLDTVPKLEKQGYDLFVFSDVRYPNEADKIREFGGTVVRILRDGSGVSVNKDHKSETALLDYPNFNYIIENNGTLNEYYDKIDKIMEETGYGGEKGADQHRRRYYPFVRG